MPLVFAMHDFLKIHIDEQKERKEQKVDDWLILDGACCDHPTAFCYLFRFSLYLFCVFSFPIFVLLWLYSFQPCRLKTWQNTHPHTQNVQLRIRKKKGHADCHAYRTLDPRRPVYDELSIHPPPRRNVGVPGEEVNQSGASLYAGKSKLSRANPCLPCCVILCLDLSSFLTIILFLTLGWRHIAKHKKSRWQSVWYSFSLQNNLINFFFIKKTNWGLKAEGIKRRLINYSILSKGMDDEICPYATFHLLGFREEMDPNKAGNQFQTFPHPNGGQPPQQDMNHHRQASQSMVTSS